MSGAEPEPEPPPEVREAAEAYLSQAGGDPGRALIAAVADGLEVASHVSRGFVRWGQPERKR